MTNTNETHLPGCSLQGRIQRPLQGSRHLCRGSHGHEGHQPGVAHHKQALAHLQAMAGESAAGGVRR